MACKSLPAPEAASLVQVEGVHGTSEQATVEGGEVE
jgi:hypothetical protein